MIQVGHTGPGISYPAPAVILLLVTGFMESTGSPVLSSELLCIPHSPQVTPTAPEFVSGFAITLYVSGTILFTRSIEQMDLVNCA